MKKRKRKVPKILMQHPLSKGQKKEFEKELCEDFKIANLEAQEESEQLRGNIEDLVEKGKASHKEASEWEALSSPAVLFKQRRNRILKDLRKKIEEQLATETYNENIDYTQGRKKPSVAVAPKDVLKICKDKNIRLLISWIQIVENKTIFRNGKHIPLTADQVTQKKTELDIEIEKAIEFENKLFDRTMSFPFLPVSLRTFSRQYKLPCKSRKTLSILKKSKWHNCLYTLKIPDRDEAVCINEYEIEEDGDGLEKLAKHIWVEYQRSENFQNWKKLIAKIKGFTLGEADMLMKRRIKSGVCSGELFYTQKPNHLLAKKIIRLKKPTKTR